MMEEFFNVTFGSSLCSLHLIDTPITYESLPVVHHLRLERVPDLGYDFDRALCRFFGHRLDIIDCEGLTDAHLEHIANHCEPLHRLYITDCPKITVAGLKKFVSIREQLVSDQDEEEGSDEDSDGDHGRDAVSLFECDDEADDLLMAGFTGAERPPRELLFPHPPTSDHWPSDEII